MLRSVRERLDLAFPVIRASSSSEPGACSAMTRSSSRLPAERTLAKDSVEVNQTFGSSAATSEAVYFRDRLLLESWLRHNHDGIRYRDDLNLDRTLGGGG